MSIDMTQVAVTAVSTAVVSSFSTMTTLVLMRYFPKMLDGVEKTMSKAAKNGKSKKNEQEE